MGKNESTLTKQVASGLGWTIADIAGNQVAKLIVQILLARLLVPADFGMISILTVFIALSQSLMDSGFQNALIREKETKEEDLATVFYFNICMGLVLYSCLFVSAPFISSFFREPRLEALLKVIGLVLIINSFGLIQRTLLSKQLKFRVQMMINLSASLVSGGVAILLALKGFGIWSLVIQMLTMQGLQASLFLVCNRWWPKTGFHMISFKRLFGFGWKLMVSSLVNTLYQNVYFLLIGRLYSASDLGFYTNAQKLRDSADFTITGAIRKVSYPALSKLKENPMILNKGYQTLLRYTVFFTFPIGIGLAASAPVLFFVLFGAKWSMSIPYFQVLCLAGLFFPLHAINLNVLQVKGRSDLFLKLEIFNKFIAVSLIVLSLFLKLGIMGLVWSSVVASIVAYLINSFYSAQFVSYSTMDQIKDIKGSFFCSVSMGGVLMFCARNCEIRTFFGLSLLIGIGCVSYFGSHFLVRTRDSKELYRYLKMYKKGRKEGSEG